MFTKFIKIWNLVPYEIIGIALLSFGILLVFLLKGPFTRKFDPEFRDLVDPDHYEGIYAPFERLAFYMRGIAFPNFLTKKHFGKKNIKLGETGLKAGAEFMYDTYVEPPLVKP